MIDRRRVRCTDCRLNLDCDPGMLIRAAFSCPLFGKDRTDVERECTSFVAKAGARKAQRRAGESPADGYLS
jgi:hypothetical protein